MKICWWIWHLFVLCLNGRTRFGKNAVELEELEDGEQRLGVVLRRQVDGVHPVEGDVVAVKGFNIICSGKKWNVYNNVSGPWLQLNFSSPEFIFA